MLVMHPGTRVNGSRSGHAAHSVSLTVTCAKLGGVWLLHVGVLTIGLPSDARPALASCAASVPSDPGAVCPASQLLAGAKPGS